MPRGNDIRIRSGTTPPSAADFNVGEPAWDKSAGKLYVKNAAGSMVEIGSGSGGSVVMAATPAQFPATGNSSLLYASTDSNQLFRWETSAYVELGPIGGLDPRWAYLLPAAPTNVTATAGNEQATVTWTAPSSVLAISDYAVQFSSNGGSSWTTASESVATATTAVVQNLVNGTAYIFRVAAVSSLGQGSYSTASSSVTPIAGDPLFDDVALLLHLDGNTADSSRYAHTVSSAGFTPSSAQVKFGQSYANNTNPSYFYLTTLPAIGTGDFTLEGWFYPTAANHGYHLLFDLRGVSNPSLGYNIGFMDNTGRIFAENVGGVFGSGGASVTMNQWNHIAICRASGQLRGYVNGVQQGSAVASTFNYAGQEFTVGGNAYSPLGAEPFMGYIDEVRVTRAARYTGASFTPPSAAFLEYSALTAPAAPTNLAATAGDGSIGLTWSAPAYTGAPVPTDYVVQYSSNGGSSWTTFTDAVSASLSANVTGLTNGVEYLCRVAAINAAGTGAYSSTATATPTVPTVLTITQQPQNSYSINSSDSATFSVGASFSGGAISYQWQYYGTDPFSYAPAWINIPGATSSTFSVTPANASTLIPTFAPYDPAARLRCVVTGPQGAGSLTTSTVRWVLLSSISFDAYMYGANGTSPDGTVSVGGVTYNTMSLGAGEGLAANFYDYSPGMDMSWYSSNAFTVSLQVSDDASSWATLSSMNFRTNGFYDYLSVSALSGVTKYYRLVLNYNWPFTTTNGTTSARTAPSPVVGLGAVRATWP